MYNLPPTAVPGQPQQYVYQGQPRMPPPQYYGNNQYVPRPFIRQSGPNPGLQQQLSIGSNNAETNTSPPSLSGTPAPVYYPQPQRMPYVQQMPPQQPVMFVATYPRFPNQQLRMRNPFVQPQVPAPAYQVPPQNFPSVGFFQAPTDTDGGHGQKGHHRKGRESSESGRQRQHDSNFNVDANINAADNQKVQYQTQQQYYQPGNTLFTAQNPMFAYSQAQYPMIPAYNQQIQFFDPYSQQMYTNEQPIMEYEGNYYMQTTNGLRQVYLQQMNPQMTQMNSTVLLPDDEPPVDIETMTKALQEVSLENRMKEQLAAAASVEKPTEEEVPVDPADLEHYTPPGTPQELSPVNDQQIADMVSDLEKVEVKNQEPKQENPKHKRKPEQQHYQPPRAARTNSQRTDSWRSNASGNSQIQDEQPKIEAPRIDSEVKTPVKEESAESGSNTPTPRATPVPVEHKPEAPTVPMIGGIPLVPVETEKKAVKKEYCAYCDMLGKPMQTITSHSLFSSAGVPICPTFREDGCKICHRKGDGAHLPRFCKKFVEKENTEFKKLGHYLFNLPTEKKSKLVIRDFGSHPKSEEIKSSTDPQIQEVHASSLKNLVVEQLKWAQKDRRRFDEERFVSEHQLSYRSDRREQRGGGRGGSKGGYDKGRRKPSNDQGSSRGGSRSGRYDGQRSSRGNNRGNRY